MFKKIVKGIAIGGAAFALTVSAAHAETYEINIYGASAQFKFWTAAAPAFMVDSETGLGCAAEDVWHATNDEQADAGTQDRDAGIAICAGSDAVSIGEGETITGAGPADSSDTVIIRYTTNASYDGIRAIAHDAVNADAADCTELNQRLQPTAYDAALNQYSVNTSAGKSIPNLACMDVTVGASDVAAATFQQSSEGLAKGYNTDDGSTIDRDIIYPDFLVHDGDTTALDRLENDVEPVQTVVVPFGFFANNGYDKENAAATTPVPVDNLSRLMAVTLYSQQVLNWNEFLPAGSDLDLPVVLCLRHAGSGTAATLNAAVMRGAAKLPTEEVSTNDMAYMWGFSPQTWFNKGSSDAMKCAGRRAGAIAYADADKCTGDCLSNIDKYGLLKPLSYQGVDPTADTIRNGQYIFWSAQWLYPDPDVDDTTSDIIEAMVAFASDGHNMPGADKTPIEGKAKYWAAQGNMRVYKQTDFSFPVRVTPDEEWVVEED